MSFNPIQSKSEHFIPPTSPSKKKSQETNKEREVARKVLESSEIAFNELVASLEKKGIDEITSTDVKELKSLIKQRIAKDPNHSGIEKAGKVIGKVMQRESRALNSSIAQESIDKHEKNLKFFVKLAVENKEIYAQYVKKLNKKPVNRIERYEIDPFLSMLKLKVVESPNEQIQIAGDLVRKIMEREKMAFKDSYIPSSASRHDENIGQIEDWMTDKYVWAGTSGIKLDEYTKKINKLCKSLSTKTLDQITSAEVKEFMTLVERDQKLFNRIIDARARQIYETIHSSYAPGGHYYSEHFSEEDMNTMRDAAARLRAYDSVKAEHPNRGSHQAARDVAYNKVLLREAMALSNSHLQSSIERHKKNIEVLKTWKS